MEGGAPRSRLSRVAFIGNYAPRQCGIATFTTDLCEAIAEQFPATSCIAVPVNDIEAGYEYPSRVRFELAERDIDSYLRAADYLNINNVDLVCLQHEYGIFGGRVGSHILALMRELRMPIVTTLHTVLREPDADQLRVLQQVAALSDRVVVMSERGAEFLRDIYGVPAEKIDLIPHGIPDVPFVDSSSHKEQFGVEGKTVLLSFGLLSASKGIETVIAALPQIIKEFPDVVYFILGATHPHVLEKEGESYRLSLQWLAEEKGVDAHVVFYNRFVSLDELIDFIGAADIYLTPYLNEAQITSGTLAYTVGAGKAVISTPYWYAEELLGAERGMLVPFADSDALATAVTDLLGDDVKRDAMRQRAYRFGRAMIWPEVAQRYVESFERAQAGRLQYQPAPAVKALAERPGELPPLKLDHLRRMTDDTGMLQHSSFTIPNFSEGYTTDDNARALLVSAMLEELGHSDAVDLASRYLAFVAYAYDPDSGRFRNFMDFQRRWIGDAAGSDDCHGRAIWALGTVLARSNAPSVQGMAARLFELSLPGILGTTSPRAWAFALLGIHEYSQRFAGDRRVSQVREELASRLLRLYETNSTDDWRWFEDGLTYCNAALPHALLTCGDAIPSPAMTQAGLASLAWLADLQRADTEGGHFVSIGSEGFYRRGGERARFDQQPVEAQAMVSACLEAYRRTGDRYWNKEAHRALEWFLGRNDLGLPIYDPTTGGCRDGLHQDRANENQGAESTLAFLQSLLELRLGEALQLSLEVARA